MIASDQKSIDKALQWTAVAGRDLPRVVDLGIYKWLSPNDLTHENLEKILSLNDKIAVSRIASLDPAQRNVILALPGDQMRDFSRRLNDKELAAFADYERRLEPNAARRLLRSVSENPTVMTELSGEGLRHAIVDSRDQLSALNMILHEDAGLISYGRIFKDAEQVRDGNVAYRVFWERYWPSVLIAGFVLLLLLAWLRRLLFGRPRYVIKQEGKRSS